MPKTSFLPALALAVLASTAAACSASGEESTADAFELVSSIQCSVGRGAFVPQTPDGVVRVQCANVKGVALNGEATAGEGSSFTLKPRQGVNVLHVERGEGDAFEQTDIPFLYGTFDARRTPLANAIAIRVGEAGLTDGGAAILPIPPASALNLSQVGSQILRDQGNILSRFDGRGRRWGVSGLNGTVKIIRSSYDHSQALVAVTPRAGGVHIEATISGATTLVGWDIGVLGIHTNDTIDASIETLRVSADVNLAYDAQAKAIRPTLGAHDVRVEGVELDSAALNRIPFGLADGLQDAISDAAEDLINHLADPVLDLVKDRVIPKIAVSLDQLKLPSTLPLPVIGGEVNLAQHIESARFEPNGITLGLAAAVLPPQTGPSLEAPGFLTQPSKPATFDPNRSFGASVSFDYVNQALYAVWKQGKLNRQVSGPVSMFGISTDEIVADAKLPPVAFPAPDGRILLHLGELQLVTKFHSTSAGSAKVKVAVSVVAGAKIELGEGGQTLTIKPTGDDTTTKLVTELIGVPKGEHAAAAELQMILSQFTPFIESLIAHDLDLPPVAIPSVDLGRVSPGFAGRQGRFDGALKFDSATSRIAVEGKVLVK